MSITNNKTAILFLRAVVYFYKLFYKPKHMRKPWQFTSMLFLDELQTGNGKEFHLLKDEQQVSETVFSLKYCQIYQETQSTRIRSSCCEQTCLKELEFKGFALFHSIQLTTDFYLFAGRNSTLLVGTNFQIRIPCILLIFLLILYSLDSSRYSY